MPSDERGLTLVEILIALVVISVGLVGIAIVVPVSSEAIAILDVLMALVLVLA